MESNRTPPLSRSKGERKADAKEIMDKCKDQFDTSLLPVKLWILDNLADAIKKEASLTATARSEDLLTAATEGPYTTADFESLSVFLEYHRAIENKSNIKLEETPTLEGFSGLQLSGEDFTKVIPASLQKKFSKIETDDSLHISHVYVIYDRKQNKITLKSIYTLQ